MNAVGGLIFDWRLTARAAITLSPYQQTRQGRSGQEIALSFPIDVQSAVAGDRVQVAQLGIPLSRKSLVLLFHAAEDFGAIKGAQIVSKHGKFTIT